MAKPKTILGRELITWLGEALDIPIEDVTHISIEASFDDVVHIYVTRLGDDRLLNALEMKQPKTVDNG